jgi:cell wall hydrolase
MAINRDDPNASDSGRYTPESIARQRKIVDAMTLNATRQRPIRHWMEGVGQLGESLVAGLRSRALDDAERQNARESGAVIRDTYNSAIPGTAASVDPNMTPSPNPASAMGGVGVHTSDSAPAGAPKFSIPDKVYSNDEPSPLDPPSGTDRSRMIATILGEAANQPPIGQTAVASVIRNRAVAGNYGGNTPSQVVTAKNQFEPWNTQGGRDKMAAMAADPRLAAAADRAIGEAYGEGGRAPNDPTNGALNFIEPKLQTALGRPMPAWAQGPGQDIGDHRFFGGNPAVAAAMSNAPYQVAGPPVAAPMTPPAMPGESVSRDVVAAMSRTPPASTPAPAAVGQAFTGTAQPGQPDVSKLIAAASNPYISEAARTAAANVLNTFIAQNKLQHIDLGNEIAFTDQRGNVIRKVPKGEPSKGPEFGEIGTDPTTGEKLMGWRNPRDQSVTPYRAPAAANAGSSTIPPAPLGIDPKVWREAQSKRATEDAMPADTKTTSALRNEIQGLPSYKNVAQAAPVYKSMADAAGRDNRAADVNLIYGMAKIMDPGSVVRESEMSVAQAIATLPQRLQSEIKSQLADTGRLSPGLRKDIMEEAHSRMQSYKLMFDQDAGMYRGIAQRGRMNPLDVLPEFGEFAPWAPAYTTQPVEIDGYKIRAK